MSTFATRAAAPAGEQRQNTFFFCHCFSEKGAFHLIATFLSSSVTYHNISLFVYIT